MKTIELRVLIPVSKSVTVAEAKRRLEGRLGGLPPQDISWEKGTLPDPTTQRTGTLNWPAVRVLQKRGIIYLTPETDETEKGARS